MGDENFGYGATTRAQGRWIQSGAPRRKYKLNRLDSIQERLDRPQYSRVLASISDVGFHSATEILASYAGRASDLKSYFAGAEINDDMNLRLQFLAGLGVNSMAFQKVFADVLSYRKFPNDLFHGSEARIDALRTLLRAKR